MRQASKAKIEQIIEQGYEFKFGDYLGRGFEIAQKNFGGFVAFSLLYFVLSIVIGRIPYIGSIANNLFISPALIAGAYLMAHKIWTKQPFEFGEFFKGFDYIGQLAVATVVTNLIVIVSILPFGLAVADSGILEWFMEAIQDPIAVQGTLPPLPPAWTLLLLAPTVFFSISYSWTIPFIVFYKMEFWEAMEASRRMIWKQWGIVFLFNFLGGLIMLAGFLVLCIGLLFTFPVFLCMSYAAFEDVTKLNEEDSEQSQIEQHLIE